MWERFRFIQHKQIWSNFFSFLVRTKIVTGNERFRPQTEPIDRRQFIVTCPALLYVLAS